MTQRQPDETLEKLSRGIEESRRAAQRQAMELAQEYFGDSVEVLKQQMEESRSRLESLPEEISGGQDELFQELFGELMENYSKLENCLDEAEKSAAGVDLERLKRQEETSDATRYQETEPADPANGPAVEDTDAARREAQRRGIDLSEVDGTGVGGRVVVGDVRGHEERQTEQPEATEAARREANKLGIDLSKVEATGAEGQVIVSDVVESTGRVDEGAALGSAANLAGRTVAASAPEEGGPALQSQLAGGLAANPAGGALEGLGTRSGPAAREEGGGAELRVTNAARRKAEKLGVDLSRVQGSGSGGLITIKDVLEGQGRERG